jgi:hypothetical protein
VITLMPRIAHLPGSNPGRDDMVLSPDEARPFFEQPVVITEKLDGVSLTVRRGPLGELTCGFRGGWDGALGGRLRRAAETWVRLHEDRFAPLTNRGFAVLGEWLWHRFHVTYDALPAAALFYALCDPRGRMLPRAEALTMLAATGLPVDSIRFSGVLGERSLPRLCGTSAYGSERAEGLVVELLEHGRVRWAKWVRGGYVKPTYRGLSGERNRVREAA